MRKYSLQLLNPADSDSWSLKAKIAAKIAGFNGPFSPMSSP